MNDLLNPYASPQIPAHADPANEHRTIRGSFVVDELTQRDAARGYRLRHVAWLGSSLFALPIPVILLVPFIFWQPQNFELAAAVLIGGFVLGACISVAVHVTLDWSIFWHNLRMLRRHPVLHAQGPWQVQIDEESISVATSLGQQTWPLAKVRRMELSQRPIVLWLEKDLAIALPKHGDYDEDDYASVRRTLRRRITHIGGPLAKRR